MIMKTPFLIRTLVLTTSLAFPAMGNLVFADELQLAPDSWQSFENQLMLDTYNQSSQQNQKQLRSSLSTTTKDSLNEMGLSDRAVGYMGAAIGVATQDTRIHLNDSKSLSLDLMDVSQSDRAIFFGYRKSW